MNIEKLASEPVAKANLWEALGRWSAYLASNGDEANLAPPQYLLDAVNKLTSPPASVPLEKYNKLLERLEWVEQSLKEATESIKIDVLKIISEYPSRVKKSTANKLDASNKAIAEAEGKEG